MSEINPPKSTRAAIEDEAAVVFEQAGFAAASVKLICDRVGIRPASLYFHFPGGKEQLFLSVVSRLARNYRSTIERSLTSSQTLEAALMSIGEGYIHLPPMSMRILTERDLPLLTSVGRQTVNQILLQELFAPLRSAFLRYRDTLNQDIEVDFLVGTWLTLLDSIRIGHRMSGLPPVQVLRSYVRIFVHGSTHTATTKSRSAELG